MSPTRSSTGLQTKPPAWRCLVQQGLRALTALLIFAVYRVDRRGLGVIPKTGPAVLVCNHVSFVDPLILLAAVRRPIRFIMDHRIYCLPGMHCIFKAARTIPIAPAKIDPAIKEAAFEQAAEALRNGELIGLFPEGQITCDGELNPFRYGLQRIVDETPVPVIPLALRGLWGSFFSRRYGPAMRVLSSIRPWRRVTLVAGTVVPPEEASPAHLKVLVGALRGDVC